jgi:hypothetical protein
VKAANKGPGDGKNVFHLWFFDLLLFIDWQKLVTNKLAN